MSQIKYTPSSPISLRTVEDIYTAEEKRRRELTDDELRKLRVTTVVELVAAGFDEKMLHRCLDPRAEVIVDIDKILRTRKNKADAEREMATAIWPMSYICFLAKGMVEAQAIHVDNTRGALRAMVNESLESEYETSRAHQFTKPAPVEDTFNAWYDRYQKLKFICEALPADEADLVVVALRRIFEDRKEPLYGWREGNLEEKARADERLKRYYAVWEDLAKLVKTTY
jgi:hypothetical protein